MSPLVMPTRILIVGSGGREHALAWRLANEPGVNEVVVAPGSAAIGAEPRVRVVPVDPLDPAAVVAVARASSAEVVIVGPEAPLSVGIADALAEARISVFGPDRAAARLETSKAFCREVADAAGVRIARGRAFAPEALEAALAFVDELDAAGAGAVLKADGLASGKGVIVTDGREQARDLVPSFLVGRPAAVPGESLGGGAPSESLGGGAPGESLDGGAPGESLDGGAPSESLGAGAPRLVIEERLVGREASVIALCDGKRVVGLPAARDHKRLCDGDRGPNTGGMGAYSPLPDLDAADTEEVLERVHRPLLAEMARRGTPFRGFLYAGLMLTAAGPVLLECNVRLGDPEAQVILPRLATPLGPLVLAAARGALPDGIPALVPALPSAAVGIVLAARGYPGTPKRGHPISGLDEATGSGALVFHAGTFGRPGGGYGTNGGRVLTVVGMGTDLADARRAAERAADIITWDGMQRRRDIAVGAQALAAAVSGAPVAANGGDA